MSTKQGWRRSKGTPAPSTSSLGVGLERVVLEKQGRCRPPPCFPHLFFLHFPSPPSRYAVKIASSSPCYSPRHGHTPVSGIICDDAWVATSSRDWIVRFWT